MSLETVYRCLHELNRLYDPPLIPTQHTTSGVVLNFVLNVIKVAIQRYVEYPSLAPDRVVPVLSGPFEAHARLAYEQRIKRLCQIVYALTQDEGVKERQTLLKTMIIQEIGERWEERMGVHQLVDRISRLYEEGNLSVDRRYTVSFQEHTFGFWKNYHENPEFRRRMLQSYPLPDDRLIHADALYAALKQEKHLLQIEASTEMEIPFPLILRWLGEQLISRREEAVCDQWIHQLVQSSEKISHHQVMSLVDAIERLGQGCLKRCSLGTCFLLKIRSQIPLWFAREDHYQLEWLEGLHPGDVISENPQIILGERVEELPSKDDLFFRVQGSDALFVRVPKNPLKMLLDVKLREEPDRNFGFRLTECMLPNEDRCGGKYVLHEAVFSLPMRNGSSGSLEERQRVSLSLANHLHWMLLQRSIPGDFDRAHLVQDQHGEIKTLYPMARERENYLLLERCAEAMALGDDEMLKYLSHVSGVADHPVACYYRELIKQLLSSDSDIMIDLDLPPGCRRNEYRERTIALYSEIKQLREEMRESLQQLVNEIVNGAKLRKKTVKAYYPLLLRHFLDLYCVSGVASRVLPHLKETSLQNIRIVIERKDTVSPRVPEVSYKNEQELMHVLGVSSNS